MFSKIPLIKLGSSIVGTEQIKNIVNNFEGNRIDPEWKGNTIYNINPEADAMIVPEYDVN